MKGQVEEQSAFRKQIAKDNIGVFLDLEYFGETHKVAGDFVQCVVDEDIYDRSAGAREYGATVTGFVLFVRECDVKRQLEGSQIEFDGRLYTVDAWRTDEGMHQITLRKQASY